MAERIKDLLAGGPTFSFEFFPPKSDEAERTLEKTLGELEPLGPSFVSVTYGAGGSTRERTRDIVVHIERDTSMTAMAHLTCMNHSTGELQEILQDYVDAGIGNILALGGDPSEDPDAPEGDLTYAAELVELVKAAGDFSIGVAAHPELHPRSTSREEDRRHLADKLALADFGITQFFFTAEDHLRMVDELASLGCDVPVLPGIMPVTNLKQIVRFSELSGATFPPALAEKLEAVGDDPADVRRVGVEEATRLCQDLLDAGVPGLHFYTLNRSTATREIYRNLGLG
jgi:methylenetetrahydrofolate reductase (NADPH)